MKSILFFLLSCVFFCACTANAQTYHQHQEAITETPASCDTFHVITLASNVLMNENSFVGTFKNHTIIYGRTWNCFAIYEDDDLLYFGDGETVWDGDTYYMSGGDFKASVNLSTGVGILEEPGSLKRELALPIYNGRCSRTDWAITKSAN